MQPVKKSHMYIINSSAVLVSDGRQTFQRDPPPIFHFPCTAGLFPLGLDLYSVLEWMKPVKMIENRVTHFQECLSQNFFANMIMYIWFKRSGTNIS